MTQPRWTRSKSSASGDTVVLEKQGDGWMLTSPMRYRADQNVVTAAVGKGKSIEVKNVVSSNPEKQSVFQVDSTGPLVQMYAAGTVVAGFRVGKPSASYTETYVRKEGSNDVYLADGMFNYLFAHQPKDWRDKSIYRSEPETYPVGDLQIRRHHLHARHERQPLAAERGLGITDDREERTEFSCKSAGGRFCRLSSDRGAEAGCVWLMLTERRSGSVRERPRATIWYRPPSRRSGMKCRDGGRRRC